MISALAAAAAVAPLLGANIRLSDAGDIPRIAAAGFSAVRTDLAWSDVERDKGRYDFQAYDRLVDALSRHRLTPILILDYGNAHYDGGDAPRGAEAREAFARFARAAASRYAGRGVVWEIWNEPNLPAHWRPAPNARDYVALAAAASAAIRSADPTAFVVGLSLGGCVWDRAFAEAAIEHGLLDHVDALSVHPYPEMDPDKAAAFYAELNALVRRRAPERSVPLLCTEIGTPTHDEARQRADFLRIVQGNARLGIAVTVWYCWKDDEEGHYGVVDRNGRAKAILSAVRGAREFLDAAR
jgi:hypothetical protein